MFLEIDKGFKIYYKIIGNPKGKPVIVLHGGPGAGMDLRVLRLFDLTKWRVLLWDQRGCGKSIYPHPHTTWDHVSDMEKLRAIMNCEKWVVFGGSWGSTLALAYASKHLKQILAFVLRGICLMEPWENEWLYGSEGVARLFPEEFQKFSVKRGKVSGSAQLRTYRNLLQNPRTRRRSAKRWDQWETSLSSLRNNRTSKRSQRSQKKIEIHAIIENNYFLNNGWIPGNLLLRTAKKIPSSIPVQIVQGKLDFICPPASALRLASAIPHAKLHLTEAGHLWDEPETERALKAVLRTL